jgi:hypothetical protein
LATAPAATLLFLLPLGGGAQVIQAQDLRLPQPAFKGKVGLTYKDSGPDFPKPVQAPKDATNVLLAYDGGKPGASGTGAIFINGQKVAEGRIDRTEMTGYSFDVGEDSGTPAGDYQVPFRFTGKLEKLTVDLK